MPLHEGDIRLVLDMYEKNLKDSVLGLVVALVGIIRDALRV